MFHIDFHFDTYRLIAYIRAHTFIIHEDDDDDG